MSLRLPACTDGFLFCYCLPRTAGPPTSSTPPERYVVVPDRIGRVMAADQSAAVLIYVLAPESWSAGADRLSREQRALMPAKLARLPVVGHAHRTEPYDGGRRGRPAATGSDRRDGGRVSGGGGARRCDPAADRDPLHHSRRQHPARLLESWRSSGQMLGVGERGQDLAYYTRTAVDNLRGRLLVAESTSRPAGLLRPRARRPRNRPRPLAGDGDYRPGRA